ncbi:MAG TPA: hypothetical protein VGJ15_10135 [Pirellulales bacterium]
MPGAAGKTHRGAVVGLLAAVVAITLGAVVYRLFFYQSPEVREIGWVLEVTGDGWTLQSDETKLLKVGDRLPAGGTLVPKTNDKLTTITVCDFEGNPKCYVGTGASQKLPTATVANFGSKLWRRIADSYEPKDIHAISRGPDGLQINSLIAARSEQGTVDLSKAFTAAPKSTYTVRFHGLSTKRSPSPTAAAIGEVVWNSTAPNSAASPELDPGLYEMEVSDNAPGSEAVGCLLLVCPAGDFPQAEQVFAQAIKQVDAWPEDIRDSLGEKNRRALVRSLADDLPNDKPAGRPE